MAVGAGIESMKRRRAFRVLNNSNLPKGDRPVQAASVESEPMTITVLGTEYNVFIPGVSDPDGTGDDLTYIP